MGEAVVCFDEEDVVYAWEYNLPGRDYHALDYVTTSTPEVASNGTCGVYNMYGCLNLGCCRMLGGAIEKYVELLAVLGMLAVAGLFTGVAGSCYMRSHLHNPRYREAPQPIKRLALRRSFCAHFKACLCTALLVVVVGVAGTVAGVLLAPGWGGSITTSADGNCTVTTKRHRRRHDGGATLELYRPEYHRGRQCHRQRHDPRARRFRRHRRLSALLPVVYAPPPSPPPPPLPAAPFWHPGGAAAAAHAAAVAVAGFPARAAVGAAAAAVARP